MNSLVSFPIGWRMAAARRFGAVLGLVSWMAVGGGVLRAQDTSTKLTDKIYQGSGVIDLLKDVSAATLQSYLASSSGLLLGVDVNENASGNETSDSLGVAIRSMTLRLTTTAGDFAFSDVFTNATALIKDSSGATAEYYTLFGQAGSSQITSSTTGFNLSSFDDLLELRDVSFSGDIIGAKIEVAFVSTVAKGGANELFFDFSGGFEDFALLSRADAISLESAAIGLADAPSTVTYESAPVSETILAPAPTPAPAPTTDVAISPAPAGGGVAPASSAPGAPLPPVGLFAAAAALFLLRERIQKLRTKTA